MATPKRAFGVRNPQRYMRYFRASVTQNLGLGAGYFLLRLAVSDAMKDALPGQFVMLRGDWERDPLLPRAFSILGVCADGSVEILAKTVGRGTALLERTKVGDPVYVLGPLGNTFPAPQAEVLDLLIAGGVGLPPVLMQAEYAVRVGLGAQNELIYGGRGAGDILLRDRLDALGMPVYIMTEDGSLGVRGRVTDCLQARIEALRSACDSGLRLRILACGPNPMLHAVGQIAAARGIESQLSLEEVMACGIGVCLGCAIPARSRPYRYVCKDGPVFSWEEIAGRTSDKA